MTTIVEIYFGIWVYLEQHKIPHLQKTDFFQNLKTWSKEIFQVRQYFWIALKVLVKFLKFMEDFLINQFSH